MIEPQMSVVVPVYSVEKEYFEECILSLKQQTLEAIEIIIVADGVKKEILDLCKSFEGQDERIRVVEQENQGVAVARNNGILNAKAPYITFVDADDLVEPTFFEGLLCPTKINMNLDFVQGGCTNYSAGLKGSIEQQYTDKISSDFIYLFNNFRGLTVSKLFRLENVKKGFNGLPIKFDENMRFAEDMALL